ncbi:hypothetical protein [Parasulfitobacter algicola]|uniref:Response regulatory domain-containing protein n=1 Tax=Parasulfitobacter algicola TaxID=2614809 RepID=A0ABX2IN91_9RHOB|nr:hypothetical protein [Sulfitobacter algicola]NSX54015.1 hypothetical protein [Sulfitobacter algicola]
MHALVLDSRFSSVGKIGTALKAHSISAKQKLTVDGALSFLRTSPIDLLILRDYVGDQHTLSVSLAAEYYNPNVSTILLSDRNGEDADELFDLLPSLYSILGNGCDAKSIAKIANSAAETKKDVPLLLGKKFQVAESFSEIRFGKHMPVFATSRIVHNVGMRLSA